MDLLDDAREMSTYLRQLRREIHREPEVGLSLSKTQEKVLNALDGLPLELSTGIESTSITAVLHGTAESPSSGKRSTVLLRGDMDALPIHEQSGEDFAATNGAMHACGHDLHTTALVGAARLLAAQRNRLSGDVVFMFQPGEEGWQGAEAMIREGVLDASGRRADHAYAIHVSASQSPNGLVVSRPGVVLAAAYRLEVSVSGPGGHGAMPDKTRDPITAIAEMIGALQTAVTRNFNVFDPVVLTVGTLHAGTRHNIIPEVASFEATVRTFSSDSESRLREIFTRCLKGLAMTHGVDVDIQFKPEFSATVNDASEVEFTAGVVRELLGEQRYATAPHPVNASEDFSLVLDAVPGAMLLFGACPPEADPDRAPGNHSPLARFDEAILPEVTALLSGFAMARLTG
ncbi:M20 family metallopeptidase [Nocardia sp. 2YAB30]|uniref:M20 metallopeptidase family protein n=1 Tax=unclassified Nocardia TaxID=2637762 RepID=UPI003F9BE3FB